MDGAIHRITEQPLVPPPRRDRRAREEARDEFRRELEHATEDEEEAHDDVVIPRPRRSDQPVAPPAEDEAGYRVDVEA